MTKFHFRASNPEPEVVCKVRRLAHDVAELLLVDGARPVQVGLGQNLIIERDPLMSEFSACNISINSVPMQLAQYLEWYIIRQKV